MNSEAPDHRVAVYAEPCHPSPNVLAGRVVLLCDCGWRKTFEAAEWLVALAAAHP